MRFASISLAAFSESLEGITCELTRSACSEGAGVMAKLFLGGFRVDSAGIQGGSGRDTSVSVRTVHRSSSARSAGCSAAVRTRERLRARPARSRIRPRSKRAGNDANTNATSALAESGFISGQDRMRSPLYRLPGITWTAPSPGRSIRESGTEIGSRPSWRPGRRARDQLGNFCPDHSSLNTHNLFAASLSSAHDITPSLMSDDSITGATPQSSQ